MTTRRKKANAILFSLFMVISMIGGSIAFGSSAAAANSGVEVDSSTVETDLIVNTSDPTAYDSIQPAVNNASDGETVAVRPGTYNESVVIKNNITLVAPDGATFDGPESDTFGTAGIQIAPDTTAGPISPTISGLTIEGYDTGLIVGGSGDGDLVGDYEDEASGDWVVENVTIRNTGSEGIDTSNGVGDWQICDSRIEDTTDQGIYADGATGEWTIKDTTITRTGQEGVRAINTASRWVIRDTTIENVSDVGIDASFNSADWVVRNATIVDNDGTEFSNIGGISALETSGDWLVTESRIENNGGTGIGLKPGDEGINPVSGNWTVTKTRIAGNNGGGINAQTASTTGNATYNYWGASDGPSGDFSGGGNAVVGNISVEPFYTDAALTTLSEEPLTDSNFSVSIDTTASQRTTTEGSDLSVVAEITNVGGVFDSQTIAVDVLDQTKDGTTTPVSGLRESIELDPGEATTIETTVRTNELAPGEYTLTTYSKDTEDNLAVTISDDSDLELSIMEFNDSVVAGDDVSVTANLTYIDDTVGEEKIEFLVDGDIVETRTVDQYSSKTDYDVSGQRGIALGDDSIYVTQNGNIVEINRATGNVISQFTAPEGTPRGLTYADGSLWFADTTDNNFEGGIVELNPGTGEVQSRITNDQYDPTDLTYNDGSLWVLEITSNSVRELDPDTGEQLSQFDVRGPLGTTVPRGLAYQNETLWVGTGDTNELGQFTTDGDLLQRTGKRDTIYSSLASDGAALYGPGTDGNLTVLRQFDDSDLSSGEQTTETFVYQTNETDVPEVTATVTSESATDSVTVSVNEANGSTPTDQLVVDSIQGPNTLSQTQRLSVSATVANPTSSNTTDSVAFVVDADQDGTLETVDTRELTLAPGANTTVGFTAPTSFDPGEYSYGISAADETQQQVTVVDGEFKTAVSTGDPHLVTFDGVAYDYMAAGEYTLVRELTGPLEIQARQEPVDRSNSVTINTALATTVDGESVVIDVTDSTPVQINSTPTEISDGEALAVGNGTIKRTGNSYAIVYPGDDDEPDPTDERVIVDGFGNRIDIEVRLDADRGAPVEGILGNIDDNSSNDIALANGTVVSSPSNSNELYGPFRDDWRVTENTTLFDYEGDNCPETYYNPTIPSGSFTVNDIDPDTRAEGEQLAIEAGLTPGTSAYRNALIDYALTGDESYFSSAQQQNASTDINETVTPDRPPELNGSNSLSVSATNASGDIVPGAEIKLYNESFVILDSRQANQTGIASWSTLTAGEYNVELYGPEGAFWGGTKVTLDADGARTTVQRTAPRLSQIELNGDRTEEVQIGVGNLTVSYYGGRPIAISSKVQNDGPERPVRVRIQVDTNNDDSVEKNVLRGGFGTNISSSGNGFYGYKYDPSTNGTKQVRVVTEAYINDSWSVTGLSGWIETFEVEHNIIGYDPRAGEFSNSTTSDTVQTYPYSIASNPKDARIPADVLFGEIPQSTEISEPPSETRNYPWSPVGSILIEYPDFDISSCSGTVIENRHILTAAHCVYKDGEFNSGFSSSDGNNPVFAPGKTPDSSPYGRYNITKVQMYKKWTETGNRSYDLAVLTLNESVASETGTFGYEANPASSYKYRSDNLHLTGYPSDSYADYVDKPFEMWDLHVQGEDTQIAVDLIPLLDESGCKNLCHDYTTGSQTGTLNRKGLSGGPVWLLDGESPIIITVNSGGTFPPNRDNPLGEDIAEEVTDAYTDSVGIRITDKKYSDIGQMIDHGYAGVPAENPNPNSDTPTPPDGGESGTATGDPHLTTYDGVAYDFQAAGEFILTNNTDGSPHVQARLRPVADRDVSVISAVATELNGTTVTVDARDEQMLTVGGTSQSLAPGESMTVDDGEIFRTPEKYVVVYPGADGEVDDGDSRLEATVAGDRLDVVVKPDRTAVDSMTGLLGSPDGNPENDLVLTNGTTLSASPDFDELYGPFREDYRVTAENSLFDYDDGESAAGFYDPNYPSDPVTVDDLPADDREAAIDAATNAGLEPGTTQFRDAVLDYALTKDQTYLASASMAADETEVTTDATSAETPLTAPKLTVEAEQVTSKAEPLDVTVGANHSTPDNVRVVIANGTQIVFEENVTGAFESEETVSWDTTVDGEPVADGVYTLGVVATSETGVRNTSTRGLLVDNTPPSVTVETNDTDLNATVDNTTVAFSYNDTASGVDPSSVSVLEDGTTVTERARVTERVVEYELTDLEPGDNRTVEVRVADAAGLETNRTVSVTVATADDPSEATTSGGGGGGSVGTVSDTLDEPAVPSGPSILTTETISIDDMEPATTGTSINVSVGPLELIRFGETETDGSIAVGVYDAEPVRDPQLPADRTFITGVEIATSNRLSDRSATLEMELTEAQLNTVGDNASPDDFVVLHASSDADTYQPIETEATSTDDGLELTAHTDSFSRFIVTVDEPDELGGEQSPEIEDSSTTKGGSTTTEEPETPTDEPAESPLPQLGPIMMALALILVATFVIRRVRN